MKRRIPTIIERDETGFWVIESPIFRGCYAQGKTMAEAEKNFQEVLDLLLEEPENRQIWENFEPKSYKFKTLTHA